MALNLTSRLAIIPTHSFRRASISIIGRRLARIDDGLLALGMGHSSFQSHPDGIDLVGHSNDRQL